MPYGHLVLEYEGRRVLVTASLSHFDSPVSNLNFLNRLELGSGLRAQQRLQ